MAQLPAEHLRSIFQHLHLKQKLECMLVCRAWARVLVDDGYILETIEVTPCSSGRSYNCRLDRLIRRANRGENQPGSRCKRLLFDNNMKKVHLNSSVLSSAFPSVEMIFLGSLSWSSKCKPFTQHDHRSSSSDPSQFDPFCGWRQSLKTVIDGSSNGFFFLEVIKSGVMNQLSTLVLRPHRRAHALSNAQIFKQLKSAPQLTTLVTDLVPITVNDLEILHDSAPNLISLTIESDISFDIRRVNSLTVVPAKQLRILSLLNFSSIRNTEGLFLYIKKKYSHLNEFRIYSANYLIENAGAFIWKNLISTLNSSTIDSHTKYNSCINDPSQKHTPFLKILDQSIYNFNILRKNDLSLPIFQCLCSLSVCKIPCILEFSKFNKLKGLKELTLDYSKNSTEFRITLNSITNMLSSNIETLCLKHTSLTIDRNLVEQLQSGIIHLKLINVNMDSSIPEFMESHFPKLKSLVLYECGGINSFELPAHYLSCVEITLPGKHIPINGDGNKQKKGSEHLMLTTRNDIFYYILPVDQIYQSVPRNIPFIDKQDRAIHRVLKACAPNNEMTYFQFKCADVQALYFYDHLLL